MRLTRPDLVPAAEVAFTFDGRAVAALAGETIAAALAAADEVRLRRHPDGGARGLWCGMGACFDCVVTVDGQGGQRACLTKVAPGMAVSSSPPDAASARPLAAQPGAPAGETAVDCAVVGAGPAGMTAALHLARAGLDVLLLDERPELGGQYLKPVAPSHREKRGPLDRQFAEGAGLRRAVLAAGVTVWHGASVWSAFAPDELGVFHEGRQRIVRPRSLLLAPGAYERPVPIPSWTLPGVMTTGAAQTLARSYRVFPGQRVVVAGNGPLNLQLAAELAEAGVQVLAVVEAAPAWSPRRWREAARATANDAGLMARGALLLASLRRRGVPVLWGSQIVSAEGDGAPAGARLVACTVATPAGTRRFELDVLTLGHGLIPSTELARQLGCRHRFVDRHVGFLATEADREGRTSVEGVFAIGDGAVPGGAVVARTRAVLAADAILRGMGRPGLAPRLLAGAARALARAERFQGALWSLFEAPAFDVTTVADDVVACRCEGVAAGPVRAALREFGADIGIAKRLTRAGMGRCQGRNCAGLLARMVTAAGGAPGASLAFLAPRPAAKPVPLAAVAVEQAEWAGHRRSVPPALVPRPERPPPRRGPCTTDVLVIGAGVVGACVARALARAGEQVLVVDRDAPAQQASTANAGSLHVQLLSFDFGAKAQAGGGPAAETLCLGAPAVALWREIAAESGRDLGLRITGGLMVAETERDLAFLAAKAGIEARHGVETHILRGNALHDLEPNLSPALIGAALCPAEGKIDPLTATFAVLEQARQAGAAFRQDAPVLAIEQGPGGFEVETGVGRITARRVVNCAGAWAPRISAMVARPIPVAGAPLQMMVTEPGPPLLTRLVMHADRHLSLKQTANGALLIGGGWSAGLDEATGASKALRWAMEGNAWVACRVLPAASGLHLLRVWAGMNIDIDGAPILGEMPGAPGFWNCVTSNGYTLAPIVAEMTAEAIVRGRPPPGMGPFTLDRF